MSDFEFEHAFLGHAIEFSDLYAEARAIVDASKHFGLESSALVWSAIWQLVDAGQPCTYRAVAEIAHTLGLADSAVKLKNCQDAAGSAPEGAAKEALEVLRRAQERRSLAILGDGMARISERSEGLLAICSEVVGKLCLLQTDTEKTSYSGPEAARNLEESLDARLLGRRQGVTTGIPELDKVLAEGLVKGRVVTLAARTGVGKTSFALSLAAAAIKNQARVVFISFEMAVDELLIRMCSQEYRVPQRDLFLGIAQRNGYARELANFSAFLAQSSSEWISEPDMDIDQLAGRVTTLHAQRPVDVLIVDYIQQVDAAKNHRGNRVEEIEEVMRALKTLARRLDICVVAVAQLNRGNEEDGQMKAPNIANIHGSSSIERYSDQVLLLHRADRQAIHTDLIVGKNRHGPSPRIPMHFEPQFTRFTAEPHLAIAKASPASSFDALIKGNA